MRLARASSSRSGIAQILGEVSLGIEVHEEHTGASLREESTHIGYKAGLEDPAFAVDYRDYPAERAAVQTCLLDTPFLQAKGSFRRGHACWW